MEGRSASDAMFEVMKAISLFEKISLTKAIEEISSLREMLSDSENERLTNIKIQYKIENRLGKADIDFLKWIFVNINSILCLSVDGLEDIKQDEKEEESDDGEDW